MSTIDVNIAESRATNTRLIRIRNNVNGVSIRLNHLLSMIDHRVLNQRNLRTRINNVRNDVTFLERDLLNLQVTITNMLNRYEETDRNLASRVPNMEVGASRMQTMLLNTTGQKLFGKKFKIKRVPSSLIDLGQEILGNATTVRGGAVGAINGVTSTNKNIGSNVLHGAAVFKLKGESV